jgi:hypothetical protein
MRRHLFQPGRNRMRRFYLVRRERVGHGVLLAEKIVCGDLIVVVHESCVREKRIEQELKIKLDLPLIARNVCFGEGESA